jgi:hypothetical protein
MMAKEQFIILENSTQLYGVPCLEKKQRVLYTRRFLFSLASPPRIIVFGIDFDNSPPSGF